MQYLLSVSARNVIAIACGAALGAVATCKISRAHLEYCRKTRDLHMHDGFGVGVQKYKYPQKSRWVQIDDDTAMNFETGEFYSYVGFRNGCKYYQSSLSPLGTRDVEIVDLYTKKTAALHAGRLPPVTDPDY